MIPLLLALASCRSEQPEPAPAPAPSPPVFSSEEPGVLRLGALLDLSGPQAPLGQALADGLKRGAARAQETLPEGWTLELEIVDHGFNPQSSVMAYSEHHRDWTWIALVQGSPNLLPLGPMIERDQLPVFAVPDSSSTRKYTQRAWPLCGEQLDAVQSTLAPAETLLVLLQDDFGADCAEAWSGPSYSLRHSRTAGLEVLEETQRLGVERVLMPPYTPATVGLLAAAPADLQVVSLGTGAGLGLVPQFVEHTDLVVGPLVSDPGPSLTPQAAEALLIRQLEAIAPLLGTAPTREVLTAALAGVDPAAPALYRWDPERGEAGAYVAVPARIPPDPP